ncbi:unnamed protein product [Spirodela intermedia]|uniref:Uncharacterized protein n=1 Tax=Spirodela intermedia TaxID=51605 RepID=A0A7I8KMT4_SPIIN|nr:unnamed protein product [Spirodela intermedia]
MGGLTQDVRDALGRINGRGRGGTCSRNGGAATGWAEGRKLPREGKGAR